jgi:hypothetical protein
MESSRTLAAAWNRLKAKLDGIENPELESVILDYRAAVIDLTEEIFKLEEQLRNERSQARIRDEFVFERNASWRKTENGGLEGAYCPACLEASDRPIHLVMTSTGLRCPYCDVACALSK